MGTKSPTKSPVTEPTAAPVVAPTEAPVVEPTEAPVVDPTAAPVVAPTGPPVVEPTEAPTVFDDVGNEPTNARTITCVNTKGTVYVTSEGKKKDCSWVKKGNLKKRKEKCKRKYEGVVVKDACPKTCGTHAGVGPCKFLFEG